MAKKNKPTIYTSCIPAKEVVDLAVRHHKTDVDILVGDDVVVNAAVLGKDGSLALSFVLRKTYGPNEAVPMAGAEQHGDAIYTDFFTCPACGNGDIQSDFAFCPGCGRPLNWKK